jgi:hypothetical protein
MKTTVDILFFLRITILDYIASLMDLKIQFGSAGILLGSAGILLGSAGILLGSAGILPACG